MYLILHRRTIRWPLHSHFKRVVKYARPSDYVKGLATFAFGPSLMLLWERIAPSHVHKGGFASVMRLSGVISAGAGFLYFYNCSICIWRSLPISLRLDLSYWAVRFYGVEENKREVEMDMREMVDKVKKNEPLYGRSSLTSYMQGVASRNSRYSGVWLHVIPWFNFVNHDQVSSVPAFIMSNSTNVECKARCGHSKILQTSGKRACRRTSGASGK